MLAGKQVPLDALLSIGEAQKTGCELGARHDDSEIHSAFKRVGQLAN